MVAFSLRRDCADQALVPYHCASLEAVAKTRQRWDSRHERQSGLRVRHLCRVALTLRAWSRPASDAANHCHWRWFLQSCSHSSDDRHVRRHRAV